MDPAVRNTGMTRISPKTVTGIAAILLVSGCAVQKTMQATGGSRADGTVKLSYEFGMFQVPNVDMAQGTVAAARRCASWGYSGAEPFGGQTKVCNGYGGGNSNSWLVTVEFQCTGTPIASK
jgi:hypothetical protein